MPVEGLRKAPCDLLLQDQQRSLEGQLLPSVEGQCPTSLWPPSEPERMWSHGLWTLC
jgi:hypothetical protein